MVKFEIIENHIENMEKALVNLRKYEDITYEEFSKSLDKQWIAERGLEILIQSLIDIGAHILSANAHNDWYDYQGVIVKLGKHGVIPEDFANKIAGMAGFRNILVHEYTEIDTKIVYQNLQRLDDFDKFIGYIKDYLKNISCKGQE